MIADLTGKNALITGAASGLGKGIPKVLDQQGALIIVSDIDGEEAKLAANEFINLGYQAISGQMDVRS